jgi:hypothetical protein
MRQRRDKPPATGKIPSLAANSPTLDEAIRNSRGIMELADEALRQPVSPSFVVRSLDPTVTSDGFVSDLWALVLHPLRFWPSDLIRMHGTCVLFHPLVQEAINRLFFEAAKPFVFKNRPETRAGWQGWDRTLKTKGEKRELALRDDVPSAMAREAREELKRIATLFKKGHAYPASYRDVLLLIEFEELVASGIGKAEAKRQLAKKKGRTAAAIEMGLTRGREKRMQLLSEEKEKITSPIRRR